MEMGRAYAAAKGLAGAAAPVRCMHARRHARMMHTYAYRHTRGPRSHPVYARSLRHGFKRGAAWVCGSPHTDHRRSMCRVSKWHAARPLSPSFRSVRQRRHPPMYEYDPTSSLRRPQEARASHARCQLKNAFYCSPRHWITLARSMEPCPPWEKKLSCVPVRVRRK